MIGSLTGDDVWKGVAGEELKEQQACRALLQQGKQQGVTAFKEIIFQEFVLCSELDWWWRGKCGRGKL